LIDFGLQMRETLLKLGIADAQMRHFIAQSNVLIPKLMARRILLWMG